MILPVFSILKLKAFKTEQELSDNWDDAVVFRLIARIALDDMRPLTDLHPT